MLLALTSAAPGCKSPPKWEQGKRYFHYSARAKVGTFDPVRNSSSYDNLAQSQVYETLLEYEYLVRPYQLTPLLLKEMPKESEDKLRYQFELKPGVRFHDDPCFSKQSWPFPEPRPEEPAGTGREVVAQDVIWSLIRMTDRANSPTGWWLYRDRIRGLDDFKARMDKRPVGAPFEWTAPIEGFKVTGRYSFEIALTTPFPQFLDVLAMGTSAVVPRECAEHYGPEFSSHPVGTGPFKLEEWVRGSFLRYTKNEKYHPSHYPDRAAPELAARGLLADQGKQLPLLDGLVFHVFEQDQPMWLKFRVGDLDATQTPAEYHDLVFNPDHSLRSALADEGMGSFPLPLLDFIYRGFNMEDPIVGAMGEGFTPEQTARAKKLRQAISAALDTRELNLAFYNDNNVLYDGPIPPGLSGHTSDPPSPMRGLNLERAKRLLAEAGYPEGKGLPVLELHTSRGSNSEEQGEMLIRQLGRVGIRIELQLSSFPELQDKLQRKKAQLFGLAWGADYPDAENFLQLFYGPNKTPGSNKFNYDNPEYNRLFEQARVMTPSPERDVLYAKLRDMVIEDCPAIGSMARTRSYVWNQRVKNFMPSEVYHSWYKYIDVEPR